MTRQQQALALRLILTDRQTEICQCVWKGMTDKEIAGRLGISHKTVEFHVKAVRGLLGTPGRARLAVLCDPLFSDGTCPEEWDKLPREARERYQWMMRNVTSGEFKQLTTAFRTRPAPLPELLRPAS